MFPAAKRAEWAQDQSLWPTTLLAGHSPATLRDCARLRAEASLWLNQNVSDEDKNFIALFLQRVIIHQGDLKANPFECSLGECG